MAARTAGRGGARKAAADPLAALRPLQPAPLVLLTGPEDAVADRAQESLVRAVREQWPDVEVVEVDAAACEAGTLATATSPSLFSEHRLVVVAGCHLATDALVTEAKQAVADVPDDVVLLLRHGGGPRAKGLLDAARAAGAVEVACPALRSDEDKVRFVEHELGRARVRAVPSAVRALVTALGDDVRELGAVCALMAAEVGEGQVVDDDRVQAHVGGRVEVDAFAVCDAALAGHTGQALVLLRHALATGAEPIPVVAALASQLRVLAKVSTLDRGVRSAEAARDLSLAPWQVDRARRDLRRWDAPGLARAVLAVAEADERCKGGGRDPEYAVERAVYVVAESVAG